ncbi:MAG: PEP-utilizing enzyme [Parcubacteria group bacterium]
MVEKNINKIDLDNYQRLFGGKVSAPYFLGLELFSEFYRSMDLLAVFDGETLDRYISKQKLGLALSEGGRFYKSKPDIGRFRKNFEEYMERSEIFFKNTLEIETQNIKQEDVKKFLELVAQFYFFYSKTEFFYADGAQNNIEKNFGDFGDFRLRAKGFINRMSFEKSSYFHRLIAKLSKKFTVPSNDLQLYSIEEVLLLFKGEKVVQKQLGDRRTAYVAIFLDNKMRILFGEDAKKIIRNMEDKTGENTIVGHIANKGRVRGTAKVLKSDILDVDENERIEIIGSMASGQILIVETTGPELMMACKKAAAIVTNQGGMLSHAAIVSREFNIPCIVGTKNATQVLHDGDLIEVDAYAGIVKVLKRVEK